MFSSFTFAYLDRARVLYRSVKEHHPDWHKVALLTDIPPEREGLSDSEPFDEVIYSHQLPIEHYHSWLFKHDLVEACTAVKGPYVLQAMDRSFDAVVYLDPDTFLFNELAPICEELENHNIILTPHQLAPDTKASAVRDNEIGSLKTGIYNLGFIALRCNSEGRRFAQWWNDRLLQFCFDDVANGLFVDQRWCDHIPVFFDGVKILRDPGYNVASWNLSNRAVEICRDGNIYVNGSLLRFWHFSKLGALADTMTRRYAEDRFSVYEIWNWYRDQVMANRAANVPKGYWGYHNYADGRQIKKRHRVLYRDRHDLQAAFPNPFLSGHGTYQTWYADNEDRKGLSQ